MPYLPAFAIVTITAFLVSVTITPIAIQAAKRYDIVDKPGGRRAHNNPIPRLGGIGIFAGFIIAIIVAQFLDVPRFDPNEIIRLTGLIIGSLFIFLMGLLDDIIEFDPLPQFLSQIAAASVAILFLIFIERINNPFTGQPIEWGRWMTVTITLLWLGLMMNTVNFLDGLDGLAGGVTLIAGVILFINSAFRLSPPQTSVSLLPLALIGACAGFLIYNFHPARVFMGSSGSYFLGYALGALSIIGGAKMATILLVMGLPMLDAIWQIINRLSQGRNPMQGDRGHLHFRLVDMGYDQRAIVTTYYLFCSLFGILTLITTSQIFKFLALIFMALFVLIGFYFLKRFEVKYANYGSSSSGEGS